MVLDERLAEVCEKICELVTDNDPSRQIVDSLTKIFPGTMTSLLFYNTRRGSLDAGGYANVEDFRSYTEYFKDVNVWMPVQTALPVGRINSTDEVLDRKIYLKSEFYNDYMRKEGGLVEGIGGVVMRESGGLATFATHFDDQISRHERRRAQIDRAIRVLSPHLQRALKLRDRFFEIRNLRDNLELLANKLEIPVLLLDAAGRCHLYNRAAEDMLRDGVVRVGWERRIRLPLTNDVQLLLHTVADVLNAVAHKAQRIVVRGFDGRRLLLTIATVPTAWRDVRQASLVSVKRMSVVIIDGYRSVQLDDLERLRALFGLTLAEGLLAQEFMNGKSIQEVASERGLSRNTVRVQLAAVFQKTSTGRQSEMVSVLFRALGGWGGAN